MIELQIIKINDKEYIQVAQSGVVLILIPHETDTAIKSYTDYLIKKGKDIPDRNRIIEETIELSFKIIVHCLSGIEKIKITI